MKRLLIVDDDFGVRDSLADVLGAEGYDVAAAADGLEAIEVLRAGPAPFVILLDWMMPRCDGRQFRALQRADESLAAIPVVLMTADGQPVRKAQELGVADYLSKPVGLDRLLGVLERYESARGDGGDGAAD